MSTGMEHSLCIHSFVVPRENKHPHTRIPRLEIVDQVQPKHLLVPETGDDALRRCFLDQGESLSRSICDSTALEVGLLIE